MKYEVRNGGGVMGSLTCPRYDNPEAALAAYDAAHAECCGRVAVVEFEFLAGHGAQIVIVPDAKDRVEEVKAARQTLRDLGCGGASIEW